MIEPRLDHVQCLGAGGLHRMAYWEWGASDNPRLLMCVHGLSRQGRDFDVLARSLSAHYRVVCPDVMGRGRSDWLTDPRHYQIPAYVADMVCLLARLNATTVHWLGTSMGGLIGIGLASLPQTPIERLVLNDVGPALSFEGLKRIGAYLGRPLRFASLEAGADYLRTISAGFGAHTQEQWLALSRPMFKSDGDALVLHYDPRIAVGVQSLTPEMVAQGEALTWNAYDAIRCPTLVLRGADSDVLSSQTAQAMTQRGPRARVQEFAGVGHAPTLVSDEQVAVVRDFLEPS